MISIHMIHYPPCQPREKYAAEHRLGMYLLSQALSSRFGLSISLDALPDALEQNAYGKPRLKHYPNIHFNISHCDGLVACALAEIPIGLDIEQIHPFKDSILRKVLTPAEKDFLETFRHDPAAYEQCFYRFWTLKESRIKQSGLGLSMPLDSFSFELDLSEEPVRITSSEDRLWFYQERIEKQYFLALCSELPRQEISVTMHPSESSMPSVH